MKCSRTADGKECVFFWHEYEENGCFSNWYESPFVMDDFCYRHMEQYIMAEKAKLFHDSEMYTAILRADSPQECKNLGKQVSGYDEEVWAPERYRILLTGLRQKFIQNTTLKAELIGTGTAILAEASPYDKIFGVGLTADQANSVQEHQWPGKNLLGKALMEIRAELAPTKIPEDRSSMAKSLTDSIRSAPKCYFSDLKPSMIQDGLPGVYAITNFHTGEVLYVGRTKNLRQRLYNNHLMGPESNARLKKYLKDDPDETAVTDMAKAKEYLKENCYFQYLVEQDVLKRGQLEGLLSFMLNVKYIHEEH